MDTGFALNRSFKLGVQWVHKQSFPSFVVHRQKSEVSSLKSESDHPLNHNRNQLAR